MDLVDLVEQAHPVQQLRPVVDLVPNTFTIGIHFAGTVLAGAPARTIAHPLRTSLTADICRRGQHTFAAVLATEERYLYNVFKEKQKTRELPFLCRDGGNINCHQFS